jgi:spore germination protein GerM
MRRLLMWLIVLAAAVAAIWWTQVRPQHARVTIFFVATEEGAGMLVPVERMVEGRRPREILGGAVAALLAGPTGEERARGLSTEIPASTRLRGLTVREGIAMIDLTEAIASGGGSSSMQGRLWQIVYTGTQLPGIRQVRILIDGAERQALGGEGVLIDRPIGRPAAFPKF